MIDLVSSQTVDTIGGYLIRVSGSRDKPFRFMSDAALIMPDAINGTIAQTPEGTDHPRGVVGRRSRSHSPCPLAHPGNWADL